MSQQTDFEILSVEDSDIDFDIFRSVAVRHLPESSLVRARSGEEALAMLRSTLEKAGRLPQLIILDLNLTGMSGFELTHLIRKDPLLSLLPIVAISTSKTQLDINHAYECGVNAYLSKSLDLEQFEQDVENLLKFWSRTALLPIALRLPKLGC